VTALPKSVGKALVRAKDDLTFTEVEERKIGADISAKLRIRYGVVQDAAVHKYVTLVGKMLAQHSERPKLAWTFIVLDTDGINAFAAPGGFVHITRGALSLIRNEAELATVLGHEISHVVFKHTLAAIQKAKIEGAVGKGATVVTRNDFLEKAMAKGYALTIENAWSSGEEEDSDAAGVALANSVGYSPGALSAFLARLADRNKGLTDRNGLFASHPQTKNRIEAINSLITEESLSAKALVLPRYTQSVKYRSVALNQLPQTAAPTATEAKAEPPKTGLGKLGLGGLTSLGKEKGNSSTSSATGLAMPARVSVSTIGPMPL